MFWLIIYEKLNIVTRAFVRKQKKNKRSKINDYYFIKITMESSIERKNCP